MCCKNKIKIKEAHSELGIKLLMKMAFSKELFTWKFFLRSYQQYKASYIKIKLILSIPKLKIFNL